MNPTIDIDKSLKAERLIYKGTVRQLLWNYFSSYAGCVGTIAFFFIVLSQTLYKDYPIQVAIFLLALTLFVAVNAYFIDKLYIIKSSDKILNSFLLTESLQNRYNKIEINSSNSNILIARTIASFWAFDKTFTVLFDNNITAINLSVYGRGQMKYCLIALANYYKCKAIVNNLNEK